MRIEKSRADKFVARDFKFTGWLKIIKIKYSCDDYSVLMCNQIIPIMS